MILYTFSLNNPVGFFFPVWGVYTISQIWKTPHFRHPTSSPVNYIKANLWAFSRLLCSFSFFSINTEKYRLFFPFQFKYTTEFLGYLQPWKIRSPFGASITGVSSSPATFMSFLSSLSSDKCFFLPKKLIAVQAVIHLHFTQEPCFFFVPIQMFVPPVLLMSSHLFCLSKSLVIYK